MKILIKQVNYPEFDWWYITGSVIGKTKQGVQVQQLLETIYAVHKFRIIIKWNFKFIKYES